MKIALCGTALSGKSTLFEILTGAGPRPAGGGRGETRAGVARVPDPRLDRLAALYRPRKTTPATVEYLDLASVSEGSRSDAELIADLRSADALLLVARAWDDPARPSPAGSVDPSRDVELLLTEFLLADLDVAARRTERLEAQVAKTGRSEDRAELALLRPAVAALEEGRPLSALELADAEEKALRGYGFLTAKPLLVAVNLSEDDTERIGAGAEAFGLEETLRGEGRHLIALSAKIEAEIAALPPEDAEAFRRDLGLVVPALDRLLQASFEMLGRQCFFTVGEDECRAWTIRRGAGAREAAAAIHSDLERGFIRAEVVASRDLLEAGSWAEARKAGRIRLEGKDYRVQDGDVLVIRFAV